MRRLPLLAGALAALVAIPSLAGAQTSEPRLFTGVDTGVAVPARNNYWAHVRPGGFLSPYVGYMLDESFGVQANLHGAFHPADDDNRGFKRESDVTTLLGATVGPRISVPFGDNFEPYLVAQGGVFGGLSGRLKDEFDGGVTLGGGLDYYLTKRIAVSGFGRWNYAFIQPSPRNLREVGGTPQRPDQAIAQDIKWVTAGLGIKYDMKPLPKPRPVPPPPPPPVAQAEPAPVLPPPTKKKIVLRGVNFDFDRSEIRADARPILDQAVRTLQDESQVSVVVAGHTDSLGSDAYNMRLSERRAGAVRDYLVRQGIEARRLSVQAYGESRPVADNSTEEGRAQNRRVELEVQQ